MKIKIKKNWKIWIGIFIFIIGIISIYAAFSIINKYGGPGITLTETNPDKAFMANIHCYLGIAIMLVGMFIAIYGFFDKLIYHIKVNGKAVNQIGVVKFKSDSLNSNLMKNNLLSNGYIEQNGILFKINKGFGYIGLSGCNKKRTILY